MKLKKTLSYFLITLLVIAGITTLVPYALSYLSSVQDKAISIRTTPASELWEIQGSFNEDRWKTDSDSGIYIKNKSPRDLVIYFKYTGDLNQIFKHSDPLLVPAGTTTELKLYPLDDKDSPRLLNPLDIVDCGKESNVGKANKKDKDDNDGKKSSWKEFSGKVIVYTLNEYASLESGEINLSGKTLWDMFFARKYKVEPKEYYENKWKLEKGESDVVFDDQFITKSKANTSLNKSAENTAETDEAEIRSYLQGLQGFKGMEIVQPVVDTIETIAPGLLDEHTYLYQVFCQLQDRTEALLNKVDNMKKKITDLQETINHLRENLAILQEENTALNQQLDDMKTVIVAPPPAVEPAEDVAPPEGATVPANNSSEENGGAGGVVPTDQGVGNNAIEGVIQAGADNVHTTE
jgi:regulator of replication initiation timing